MTQIITVELPGDPAELIQKARERAATQGITLEGDERSGTFNGLGASGTYSVEGQSLTVSIDKKPFFFPEAMVEAMIRKLFS